MATLERIEKRLADDVIVKMWNLSGDSFDVPRANWLPHVLSILREELPKLEAEVLSRVEEEARALASFDVGIADCMPVMSEMNWGHWLRRSDVLSILESMKQEVGGMKPTFGFDSPHRTKKPCAAPQFADSRYHRVQIVGDQFWAGGLPGWTTVKQCTSCGREFPNRGFYPTHHTNGDQG